MVEEKPPLESNRGAVSRPNLMLLAVAVLYPIVSGFFLFASIRDLDFGHHVAFSFILPSGTAAIVLWAKLRGVAFYWGSVVAFAVWMAYMCWAHHVVITSIWAGC